MVEKSNFPSEGNFDAIYHGSGYINSFGFGDHIVISDCQLLLQSLANTFFALAMVANATFAI